MKQYKNVSPWGDLEVPSLGTVVPAGETVTVQDDDVDGFEADTFNWQLVSPKKSAPAAAPAVSPEENQ